MPHRDAAAEVVEGPPADNASGPLDQMLTGVWAAAVETEQHSATAETMIGREGFIREASFGKNPLSVRYVYRRETRVDQNLLSALVTTDFGSTRVIECAFATTDVRRKRVIPRTLAKADLASTYVIPRAIRAMLAFGQQCHPE